MSEAEITRQALQRALSKSVERSEWRGLRRIDLPGAVAAEPVAETAPEVPQTDRGESVTAKPAPVSSAPVRGNPSTPTPQSVAPVPKMAQNPAPARDSTATQLKLAASARDLDALRATVAACQACGLCETRKQTVFMDGSPSARVLFVGEAPGADEDAQGVPFVGKAGQLLTDIITKGMKLERSQVAIANVLKCRPPGNRDPEPAEKALCTPFLDRQIELINPEVIITLGRHASNHLLGRQDTMGSLRGRVHELGARKVVPTYHPSYLLRSPGDKKLAWQDIQRAMAVLGLSQ